MTSETPIAQETLTISLAAWQPALGAYPTFESFVSFDDISFGYMGAGYFGTAGYIQGKASVFYIYNQDSLGRIVTITMSLKDAKTTHAMYGGTSSNPTTNAVSYQSSDNKNFTYNFSLYNYSHFRFANGANAIYIQSIVITYELSGGSSSSQPSSEDPSSDGYYEAGTASITQAQYKQAAELFSLPATGTVNILVIPVTFSDYRCTGTCATTRKADIQKTFFGEASDTGWESLKSYYYKSSYGNLTINGTVTDWYDSTWSSSTFANLTGSGTYAYYYDPTWSMVDAAVAWYKQQTGTPLTQYDTDGDGFLDAVYLVYNNPNASVASYSANGEDVYWAYTYWNYNNWDTPSVSSPKGMTYCWASYDFMYEGYGSSSVDAHTYIHESGHVLGLDDYYSYTDGDWGAAGGVDMMDYNIVDHNAYSKYVFGWTAPTVIDGTRSNFTVTINPFESSGDFILINNAWNGSAYDEYLAIELYTPTGLNLKDSQAAYANGLRSFTIPGIKVYHVDSRLGKYDYSNNFISYTDTVNVGSSYYPYVAASNSSEYSQTEAYKLLHLLEAGGVNTFKNSGAVATNATLFTQGTTFNPKTTHSSFFNLTNGRFNDGTSIGYSFTVTSLSATSATLTFTKI